MSELEVPPGFELMPEGTGFTSHVGPVYWGEVDGEFVLGFRVLEIHSNPAKICHGGMLMTVMDMGLGIGIANFMEKDGFSPTMSMSVDSLAPAPLSQSGTRRGMAGRWIPIGCGIPMV